jgi:thioredoxin 1
MVTEIKENGISKKGNVIVDFYTGTCGPCKALNPILEEISKIDDFIVQKVDVMQNPELSQQFGVMAVPTVVFMKNNRIKGRVCGLKSKAALLSLARKSFNG